MRYIYVAISAIVLFFPVFWLFSQAVGDNWGAGLAAIFMYVWYPFMALKFLSRNEQPTMDDMAMALSKAELQCEEYAVQQAVEIEEFEDEGLFFLLDVGKDRTLCLRGQYLYEAVENGSFPSSKIRLFWNQRVGETYGVEGAGLKLLLTRKLPPLNEKQLASEILPGDRDLLEQKIEDVIKIIEKIT